ncbi:MAG TPA: hypothetical protein VNO22_06430 [Planctomycetota bacterium]|jgi:hypothetical protein|nr:hypothetical protein [Planctomycetota bacterium]
MKHFAVLSALLLAAAPESSVRFEEGGVRVGDLLVTGKAIGLREAGAAPVLVSGTLVESLSAAAPVRVSVAPGREVLLEAGVRLERAAEGFRLATHGAALEIEAAGTVLSPEGAAAFRVGDGGFDFGALGRLDVPAVTARVRATAPSTPQAGPQVGPRRYLAMRTPQQRLVFGNADPVTLANFASGPSLQQLIQVTPTGAP